MEGTKENRGVNYRTLEELFRVANERRGEFTYEISVSVLEVYNEQIRDLLASSSQPGHTVKKLEIKQVAEGVHHVPGLVEAQVHSMNEVGEVLQIGSSVRVVGSTNANEHSSRSHCILCVMVRGENLIDGECIRSIDIAGQVFGKLPERNVVSWTAIIVGHSQNGNSEKALELFCQMQQCGAKPNQFTFASFLGACATLASLEEGKQAHGQIIKAGLESSVFVGSAIVDMYAKCRSIDDAWREFDKMPQRDALSWNAIITGYAQSGHSEDALKLFCLLKQSGAKPNQFIFASLVRTCASLADLEYGKQAHAHTMKSMWQVPLSTCM